MNEITKISRELRQNPTVAEKILWHAIRNRKLGVKFRRQHPLIFNIAGNSIFFIADFACLEKKIIIEIDGKVHETQAERDAARDKIIRYHGFRVIRFNNDVVLNQLHEVVESIRKETSEKE